MVVAAVDMQGKALWRGRVLLKVEMAVLMLLMDFKVLEALWTQASWRQLLEGLGLMFWAEHRVRRSCQAARI